jgi:signal transduction histidine kinase
VTIRRRLTLGVAAIVLAALAVAFGAVYAGTGGQVRTQLDGDLAGDMQAFERVVGGVGGGAAGVRSSAQAFVRGQPYAPNARLLFARLPQGPAVTNDADLTTVDTEPDARARARAILRLSPGRHTVALPDGHRVRVLVRAIDTGAGTVFLGVGESTRLVERAQAGVLRSFILAGLLALALAAAAAVLLGTRIARPLRRMAGVAARIQEGDLDPRMAGEAPAASGDDIAVLADAFDSMLDRLQSAFDRQNAFVADASHELRTPLTVIRGQLEVLALEAHPSAEEVRRVERLVRTEVERMGRMVEDLLVLTHAQDVGFLRPGQVSLPATLDELLEAQRATADRDFRFAGGPSGTLRADPDRLAQAVRNLLRNATEHTRPGGTVTVWAREDAPGWVAIGVDDDGPGIPATERERVFARFHRADAHGPRGTGTGTGLGLAIVQAIAAAHGGEAWVDDAPLGGARVAVRLPGFVADPEPGDERSLTGRSRAPHPRTRQ